MSSSIIESTIPVTGLVNISMKISLEIVEFSYQIFPKSSDFDFKCFFASSTNREFFINPIRTFSALYCPFRAIVSLFLDLMKLSPSRIPIFLASWRFLALQAENMLCSLNIWLRSSLICSLVGLSVSISICIDTSLEKKASIVDTGASSNCEISIFAIDESPFNLKSKTWSS